MTTPLAEALLDALPQTQCRRCGYADCRGYAEAIAAGDAAINRCPPGGTEGIERLARISGRRPLTLDPAVGPEGPRGIALIDEAWCIGCTLCIKACPVDCIVGAPKRMHSVIEADCTGCELCVPACPVDCIVMVGASGHRTGWQAWGAEQAGRARERYAWHRQRLEPQAVDGASGYDGHDAGADSAAGSAGESGEERPAHPARLDATSKQALVAAALARARAGRRP